jgi:hypothetical protein
MIVCDESMLMLFQVNQPGLHCPNILKYLDASLKDRDIFQITSEVLPSSHLGLCPDLYSSM